jgi:hypothetical protein
VVDICPPQQVGHAEPAREPRVASKTRSTTVGSAPAGADQKPRRFEGTALRSYEGTTYDRRATAPAPVDGPCRTLPARNLVIHDFTFDSDAMNLAAQRMRGAHAARSAEAHHHELLPLG